MLERENGESVQKKFLGGRGGLYRLLHSEGFSPAGKRTRTPVTLACPASSFHFPFCKCISSTCLYRLISVPGIIISFQLRSLSLEGYRLTVMAFLLSTRAQSIVCCCTLISDSRFVQLLWCLDPLFSGFAIVVMPRPLQCQEHDKPSTGKTW